MENTKHFLYTIYRNLPETTQSDVSLTTDELVILAYLIKQKNKISNMLLHFQRYKIFLLQHIVKVLICSKSFVSLMIVLK
jgi:hypothetical protein